jgi:uncharacterized membrane protein
MLSPDNFFGLWAVILSGVAITIRLEQRYRWAEWVGGPTLGLLIAAVLSNLRILPTEAPAYEVSSRFLLPVAIALLLFRADLVEIARRAGSMLVPFLLCCIGTVLGAVAAHFLFRPWLPCSAELAGVETASDIGGSVNFIAVREAFAIEATQASALLVADNLVMVSAFVVLFWLARATWFRRFFPPSELDAEKAENPGRSKNVKPFDTPTRLTGSIPGIAIAFVFASIAERTAPWVQTWLHGGLPATLQFFSLDQILGNKYVLVSLLTVGAATALRSFFARLEGTHDLGVYLPYVYLFTLGLPADLFSVLSTAPTLLPFCAVVAFANVIFGLIVGKVLAMRLEPLLLTINATVGGPSTAAAMAGACDWPRMVIPAILIGLLGYAVGTPIGIAVGRWLLTLSAGSP